MDDVQTSIRDPERGEWGSGMLLNLRTLTLNIGASPVANISIDTRPNKTRNDEFLGGTDSLVR